MKIIRMSNKDYHNHPALGASNLITLLKNAKKFRLMKDGEYELKSKNLTFGSALHKYVLEPEDFDKEFVVTDIKIPEKIKEIVENNLEYQIYPEEVLTTSGKLSTSKKAKEIIENLEGLYITPAEKELVDFYKDIIENEKEIISTEDFEKIKVLKEKLYQLEGFEAYIKAGIKEATFFGEIDGVEVKCRPDLLVKTKSGWIVIDLKTICDEATPQAFEKATGNYLYFLQEALYRKVLEQNDIKIDKFLFAVVSKLDHSGAEYYEHDQVSVDFGEDLIEKAIFKYKWCSEHNEWREGKFDYVYGGFEKVNTITIPQYIWYQFQ
jgi:exodeoxyribonuclease VIII